MNPGVITIPLGTDNYSYLLVSGNHAAVIDPSIGEPVLKIVNDLNVTLQMILSTHHHGDHTGGNRFLKEHTGALIYGSDSKVACIDMVIGEGEIITLNGSKIEVLSVPGHTRHHLAFYIQESNMLFTGDLLFGAGCGRIFEGSADQMYNSLMKLSYLPDNTSVYFGHEYTYNNLQFASIFEPDNKDVQKRIEDVNLLQSPQQTTPSTIGLEKKTNPFLRTNTKTIRQALGMVGRSPVAVFAELRKRKNSF
jgi:hydroxyacylglutathione hydrolase